MSSNNTTYCPFYQMEGTLKYYSQSWPSFINPVGVDGSDNLFNTFEYPNIYNPWTMEFAYLPPPLPFNMSFPKFVDGQDYFSDSLHSLYAKEAETGGDNLIPSNDHLIDRYSSCDNLEYRFRAVIIIFRSFTGIYSVNENVIPLAINILDRVMAKEGGVPRWSRAELLGVVCFKLACEYESDDNYHLSSYPKVYGVPYWSKKEFFSVEIRVLMSLNHNLNTPPVFQFVKVIMDDSRHYGVFLRQVVKYLVILSSMDHRFVGQSPSKIAASAVYVAQRIVPLDCGVCHWDTSLVNTSGGYTEEVLEPILDLILEIFWFPIDEEVFQYYASNQQLRVSVVVLGWARKVQGITR